MMEKLSNMLESILFLWIAIILIGALLIPNIADWSAAWSCVGGYDLSGLPFVFALIIIVSLAISIFELVRHKKK